LIDLNDPDTGLCPQCGCCVLTDRECPANCDFGWVGREVFFADGGTEWVADACERCNGVGLVKACEGGCSEGKVHPLEATA
jgi:hypothetical protein